MIRSVAKLCSNRFGTSLATTFTRNSAIENDRKHAFLFVGRFLGFRVRAVAVVPTCGPFGERPTDGPHQFVFSLLPPGRPRLVVRDSSCEELPFFALVNEFLSDGLICRDCRNKGPQNGDRYVAILNAIPPNLLLLRHRPAEFNRSSGEVDDDV